MKLTIALSCLHLHGLALEAASKQHNGQKGMLSDPKAIVDNLYDYIVCGGGLTGPTLASRLTEDPNISVLVIEAGQDDHADPRVNNVRNYGQAFNTELDHGIHSAPIEWQNATGLLLVAGKTLGGSGSINGANWTKGPKTQYNLLQLLTGEDSWGWESFQEHMFKAKNFNTPGQEETADGARWNDAARA